MIFSWKQEMSLSESETVYRSLAITIYLNIYYKKKWLSAWPPKMHNYCRRHKDFREYSIYITTNKQLRASLGRSRLRVVSVTCTEVLTFCLNVIHFLRLLHETKGKQNKKSNKKTYKIHVEMKRKNGSLLKSGVWWDNRYVNSVRLYIFL